MRRVLSLSVLACLAFAPACSDPAASGTVDGADAVGDASGGDATDLTDAGDSATGTATGTATTATTDASVNVTFDIDDSDPDIVPGDPDVLVGTFLVQLVPPVLADDGSIDTAGTTSIVGRVSDGPSPDLVGFAETTAAGDCRVLVPIVPHCDLPCGGSAACVDTDVCQAYPSAQSVGQVVVTGMRTAAGATAFELELVAGSYQPRGPSLPYPAFAEGDTVAIHAGGDVYARFHLAAPGVAQLVITSPPLTLERGQALALRWTPPAAPAASSIDVKLDISHHGGTKGVLRCTTADDGALDIDGGLVTTLLDLGFAGLPTIIVTRSTSDSHTIEVGRVDLAIESAVEQAVNIPGLVSCTDTSQCPDGETCQDDLSCR